MKLNRRSKKDIFKERYNLIKRTRVVIVGHPEITNLNIYKKAAKTMRELEKKESIIAEVSNGRNERVTCKS